MGVEECPRRQRVPAKLPRDGVDDIRVAVAQEEDPIPPAVEVGGVPLVVHQGARRPQPTRES